MRRADLRRALQAGRGGRRRHAHRRLRGRPRPPPLRAVHRRRRRRPADAGRQRRAALDPCWRMPLDEEYDEALKSNFADMGNVGGRAGRRHHRGDVPASLHREVPVGAPRHRRHRLEVRRRKGRDRPAGRPADPLRARAGRRPDAGSDGRSDDRDHASTSTCRDRTAYACRLLRKATPAAARGRRHGRRRDALERLDRELWAFDPAEFIPHVRVRRRGRCWRQAASDADLAGRRADRRTAATTCWSTSARRRRRASRASRG